ncbi:17061_t:CDS:2 [Acaulospora colombiana]|uniref:17061_t:CDS:1 n=1 Tax=Acaulospora colombiana TaxID=27376 RepID=A0ACA9M8G9_9GLOM|nr:17061_t:CDS:2 [Acaulospora colombiana]
MIVVTVDVVDVAGERMHVTDKLKVVPTSFDVGSAHHIGDETDDGVRLDVRKMLVDANSDPTFSDADGSVEDSEMNACRVFGYFSVNKVTGNLHITAIGLGYGGYSFQNSEELNFTHRIDEFSFGTFYPRLVNPLDNSIEIAEARIFFKYDIEPISVKITEKRQGFTSFMTRLCGLVGGIWVTIGFIVKISNGIWSFLDQVTGGGANSNRIGNTRGSSGIVSKGGDKKGEVNFSGGMINGGIGFNDVNLHVAGMYPPGHKAATD